MSGSPGATRHSTASIPLVLEFHCFDKLGSHFQQAQLRGFACASRDEDRSSALRNAITSRNLSTLVRPVGGTITVPA
jgi:hypothetical protein